MSLTFYVLLAKILLLPPKYEIIMVPSNHLFFTKLLLVKFDSFLSKVIALPTIAITIVVALAILEKLLFLKGNKIYYFAFLW